MSAAGFRQVEWRLVERIAQAHVGRKVLADPILQKTGTSQLALLTDEAYAAGMARIQAALVEAEAAGKVVEFPVELSLALVVGRV